MLDICDRLRHWVTATDAVPASDLMDEAASEIDALRVMLLRQNESANEAVRLMGDYAQRFGFVLGGLEMSAAGHVTAEAVLETVREKFNL